MNKFLFKSSDPDLSKILSILETLQKNVLYCTYRLDWLYKHSGDWLTDNKLQKQVDDYFEDETSPQTDSVEHPDDKRDLD